VHTRHEIGWRGFGSDNQSGVHPKVFDAMARANLGHVGGYGADPYTAALADVVAQHFGADALGFPVFSGTGSNVVALSAFAGRWQSVICAECAHIVTDEGASPEQSAGLKLIQVPAPSGKMSPQDVAEAISRLRTIHQSAPAVLSISQSTELGTLYRLDELRVLVELAHAHGLAVHLDGARLPNAAAALGLSMGALSTELGIDVVSLGGTKNGLMFGEVVVVADSAAAPLVARARKGLAQLGSKQRFAAAQLIELYGTALWSELASHANAQAAELAAMLTRFDSVRLAYPVEANAVFLHAPAAVGAALAEGFGCQTFVVPERVVRVMCSWDTTSDDVCAVVDVVAKALAG
jgi:threonine aldolase